MVAMPSLLLFVSSPELSAEPALQSTFRQITELEYREADQRLAYGAEPEQYFEQWFPPEYAEPLPLIVLVHGGCWLAEYGVSHIRPLASRIASSGLAVAALEYRRVGQEGGGWPGTFDDIATGLEFISSMQDPRLDLSQVILVGHSAGGHLALWASGRSLIEKSQTLYSENPFMPRGVIGLAAITDLAAYSEGQNSCQEVTPKLMGGLPSEKPERYKQASPSQLGTTIPTVLLHGDQDTIVPIRQAQALSQAKLVVIEGAGHFDMIHPGTAVFPGLLAAIEELLDP